LSTNNFVWCGNRICEARLADNSLWRQYFKLGQISFTSGVGTNYFYNLDHLGSVREITDNSGAVVSQSTYDPYGIRTNLQGIIFSDFGYAGMYQHPRSGLNLTMFRAYSPTLGRWLSRDPLGESMGTNLYSYVMNDPIDFIDPLGLSKIDAGRILSGGKGIHKQMEAEGKSKPGSMDCRNQSDELTKRLRNQIQPQVGPPATQDKWKIWTQSSPGDLHSRGIATSSNPTDPDVILDPWAVNFKEVPHGKGEDWLNYTDADPLGESNPLGEPIRSKKWW
jgi:RHS repeat-associated protein